MVESTQKLIEEEKRKIEERRKRKLEEERGTLRNEEPEVDVAGLLTKKLGDEELGVEYEDISEEEEQQIAEIPFDPTEKYRNHPITLIVMKSLPAVINSGALRGTVDKITKTQHEYEDLTSDELLETGFPQYVAYCIDYYFPNNSWMNKPWFLLLMSAASVSMIFMAKMKKKGNKGEPQEPESTDKVIG